MLTPKKLIQIFRKWRQATAQGRRRIKPVNIGTAVSHSIASRGHVYVYTTDHKRFMVPLKYLSSLVFQELFKMSEDEYGLPSDGPIVLPCDAGCMNCIISLMQSHEPGEMDTESVLASISAGSRCVVSSMQQSQQLMLCSF